MKLSKTALAKITAANVVLPQESLLALPEKVLQFGTGVLLRGLPDYFIDKANRQGLFNGRIVVIKSTAQGDATSFESQNCLYTLCVRGIENGKAVTENIINASISRILHAASQWKDILDCAHNPQMQIIISNTTEVGLQLVVENIHQNPPASFPAKLLGFLLERYHAFGGSPGSGMVIIPTELLPDNGSLLKSIVIHLAHTNALEVSFINWLENHNHFCNSLVDRIVPGSPGAPQKAALEQEWGYEDNLCIIAEAYKLWAIKGSNEVKDVLSFAAADEGVVIVPDIDLYRELKLRLLNGTHTLSCAVALLAGCTTVKEAMDSEALSAFMRKLLHQELAPAIPFPIDTAIAQDFGNKVLERFCNPFIQHHWLSISVQYSSKIKIRVVPMLVQHYKKHDTAPPLIVVSFAAYFHFLKPVKQNGKGYFGYYNGNEYPINDEQAAVFFERWQNTSAAKVIEETLKNVAFWGEDLAILPSFLQSVTVAFYEIEKEGMIQVLNNINLDTTWQ